MRWLLFLGAFLFSSILFAWNAEGHRVVALIAWDNMTPHAKMRFQVAHPGLDKAHSPATFTEAAVWFDTVRGKKFRGIDQMHYVNVPIFSNVPPGDYAPQPKRLNALMAFNGARQYLLQRQGGTLEQVIALRILLHVVADMHQPLHAVTRVSRIYPQGDAGGNKVKLPRNQVDRRLHAFWDKGGGFLVNPLPVQWRAKALQKRWPCQPDEMIMDPIYWLAESYLIAKEKVYTFKRGHHLSQSYQQMAYEISQKRLAQAGCRLALVLNEIDAFSVPMIG